MSKKTKLELTWIGKEHRPKLEPRILLEDPDKSCHAEFRVKGLTRSHEGTKSSDGPGSISLRGFVPSCENEVGDLFDNLLALKPEDKLASQKQIKTVEGQRNDKRRSLFDAQDAIDQQREDLIGKIEGRLQQLVGCQNLFTIRWKIL